MRGPDVWSVAIVLFEMLTGRAYFQAEASSKLEWMIRNYKTLQPSIAGIQPGLREILSRSLDPDLAKRFASAAAFQSALHEWQRFAEPGPARLRISKQLGVRLIRIRMSIRGGVRAAEFSAGAAGAFGLEASCFEDGEERGSHRGDDGGDFVLRVRVRGGVRGQDAGECEFAEPADRFGPDKSGRRDSRL